MLADLRGPIRLGAR